MSEQPFKAYAIDAHTINTWGEPESENAVINVKDYSAMFPESIRANSFAGTRGQLPFLRSDGTSDIAYEDLIKIVRVGGDPEEVAVEKEHYLTREEMHESWWNYSHGSTGTTPENPSDLGIWKFDRNGQFLYNNKAPTTHAGIVSKIRHINYEFATTISSTTKTSGTIGLVVGFSEDVNSVQYTLTVIRGVRGRMWSLVYNAGKPDEQIIINKSSTVTQPAIGNWGDAGMCRLFIERKGSIFRAYTSQFGSTVKDENTLIEFDINNAPLLDMFKSGGNYGYMVYQQQDVRFKDTYFSEPEDFIVCIRTNSILVGNFEGNYTPNKEAFKKFVGMGRLLFSKRFKKLYYTHDYNAETISSVIDDKVNNMVFSVNGQTGNVFLNAELVPDTMNSFKPISAVSKTLFLGAGTHELDVNESINYDIYLNEIDTSSPNFTKPVVTIKINKFNEEFRFLDLNIKISGAFRYIVKFEAEGKIVWIAKDEPVTEFVNNPHLFKLVTYDSGDQYNITYI